MFKRSKHSELSPGSPAPAGGSAWLWMLTVSGALFIVAGLAGQDRAPASPIPSESLSQLRSSSTIESDVWTRAQQARLQKYFLRDLRSPKYQTLLPNEFQAQQFSQCLVSSVSSSVAFDQTMPFLRGQLPGFKRLWGTCLARARRALTPSQTLSDAGEEAVDPGFDFDASADVLDDNALVEEIGEDEPSGLPQLTRGELRDRSEDEQLLSECMQKQMRNPSSTLGQAQAECRAELDIDPPRADGSSAREVISMQNVTIDNNPDPSSGDAH